MTTKTVNAFALHAPTDRTALRWTASAIAIVALHAGLIAAGIAWYQNHAAPGVAIPAIMVDMAPATAAPQLQPEDVAPGPEMQKSEQMSEPPPPEPVQQAIVEEQIAPTPPVEKPEVQAPPEQKPEPTPPPEPAKLEPEPPKPKPVPTPPPPKPKPVRAEVKKKPSDTPPAPRTSAAPRADRQAAAASAASAGAAAAAALPSYRDRLNAHLQRYKEANAAGKTGVATLSFTVSRSGQVLGSRIAASSGAPELDAATLSLIRRAQPLPAFPPEMTQASMSFTVPIRYLNR